MDLSDGRRRNDGLMRTKNSPAPELDFLQSVVVFDDRAYESQNPVGEVAHNPDLLADDVLDEPEASELAELEPGELDTQTVVRSFADQGMNCAVLSPSDDGAGDTQRFLSLAKRADVVVLDWIIAQNKKSVPGAIVPASQHRTSLQLILAILRLDRAVGSRLRLMCIYSGDSNLSQAESDIAKEIETEFGVKTRRASGRIDFESARIVFLQKPDTPGIDPEMAVLPEHLAERIVREFSLFAADGLLPRLALQSLSAVRDQAHRILKRFASRLDPALLAHRAMTTPTDTEEFVIGLIRDELGAVVASGSVTRLLRDDAIESTVRTRTDGRANVYYWKSRKPTAPALTLTADEGREVLNIGTDSSYRIVLSTGVQKTFDKAVSFTSLSMAGSESQVRSESKDVDLEFAMLSSLARDGSLEGKDVAPPELKLGTILFKPKLPTSVATAEEGGTPTSADGKFFLCLQPICDSTRLDKRTAFPLLPLDEIGLDADKFGLVVRRGGFRVLGHSFKLNRVNSIKFDSDRVTETVLATWQHGAWHFKATTALYEWLGDVRIDKAHRLVNQLASDVGRVGVNEYEYLRRRHEGGA